MTSEASHLFTELSVNPSAPQIPLHAPVAEEAMIVIFGASGDLTARKLLPALYHLWAEGYLTDRAPIVGVARRDKNDDSFRAEMFEAVKKQARNGSIDEARWNKFAARLRYLCYDLADRSIYPKMGEDLRRIEKASGVVGKRVVYMATSPDLFLPAIEALPETGLIPDPESEAILRVVIEKPFGTDLASAQEITARVSRVLREDQIYRIDHYLGKETVQNILLFRFGNSIFEPMFNLNHVDHVQITVAESQGMERGRGGYYDKSGALRDVLQNHMLQLLCLVAMEPPALFRAQNMRDEKLKVLQALAPGKHGSISDWVVRGQYTIGEAEGKKTPGYREEERIPPDSRTETFVAMEVRIDNWRWAGVPFYLRTGKRLPSRVSEVAIQFKLPPLNLFTTVECEGDICDLVGQQPNTLVFRIQPHEAISLSFCTKRPGMNYQIHPVTMDFAYETAFQSALPEAYERLLLDVLRGDSTLFTRSDELEAAWQFVTPVLEYWEKEKVVPETYPAGSWGPAAADKLLRKSGRRWREPMA